MTLEISLIVALVPPALFLFLIWKADKLEREPWSTLLLMVGLGAACALLALVLEIAVNEPIQFMFSGSLAAWMIADNFVGVALMEELSKMLVIMLLVWRGKQFNCRFDGVVYGAAASLGFAALENVKYTLAYGISTGLVRAFTAIPGHFIFGIFMGAFIGAAKCAKFDGKQAKKNLLLFCAIFAPTMLHGYYDYLLTVPEYAGIDTTGLWIAYLVAMVIAAVVVILTGAKADRCIDVTKDVNGKEKAPVPVPLPTYPSAPGFPGVSAYPGAPAYPGAASYPSAQPAAMPQAHQFQVFDANGKPVAYPVMSPPDTRR